MSGRRVLITTTAYPPSTGGVQEHVAELVTRLERFDADVLTLWRRQRTDWLLGTTLRLSLRAQAPAETGVRTVAWSGVARLRMLPWVGAYYALVPVAARRIAAEMVDAIERAVPDEYLLIHNHRIGREFLAMASLEIARRRRIPFVLTPHHHPKWRGYRYSAWTAVYRAADAVLALTGAEAAELRELGVAAERIHVIGGAASDPMPAAGSRFRATIGKPRGPLVVFLGQLYEYKGIAAIVDAVASLRGRGSDVEVAFVGPATPFSRQFFTGRRESWIHVCGPVDEQTKWDALEAADVVVLPSRHEAFGRVFLEAWSKEKPVIGGRVPAVSEVIEDGENGLLVTPGAAGELAQAIDRVLADSTLAARLGAAGHRLVDTKYNWRSVAGRIEDVYSGLVGSKVTGRR